MIKAVIFDIDGVLLWFFWANLILECLVGSLMLAFQSSLIAHSGGEDLFSSITLRWILITLMSAFLFLLGIGLIVAGMVLGACVNGHYMSLPLFQLQRLYYVFYSFMGSPKQNFNVLLLPVIELLVLIFLWSISKKFN